MRSGLESNVWKYFLFILTSRRSYIAILAIYFLTLPNSTAQQIGLYTGIGWLSGFFLEIPSGYISDKFGHKKTLILAKFSLLVSTLLFIFGDSFYYFALGSFFMAFGFAFTSGTAAAFFHNTLVVLKREKEYGELDGKIKAKAPLVAAVMIIVLPFFAGISLLMPIKIYLFFDIIGIFVAFSLVSPKMKYDAEDEEGEKIWSQIKRFKGIGFYPMSLFTGIIGGFIVGTSMFNEPFVESLGFPIIFIGSVMALSRVVWFIVGHNLKIFKKIELQKLLFYEIFFFSGAMIIISQLKSPYVIGLLLAIIFGYYRGRGPIISAYYMDNFLINKRYKATMLSIKQQIGKLFEAGVIFIVGFVMATSYSFGYLVSGICMLIILLMIYPFFARGFK